MHKYAKRLLLLHPTFDAQIARWHEIKHYFNFNIHQESILFFVTFLYQPHKLKDNYLIISSPMIYDEVSHQVALMQSWQNSNTSFLAYLRVAVVFITEIVFQNSAM